MQNATAEMPRRRGRRREEGKYPSLRLPPRLGISAVAFCLFIIATSEAQTTKKLIEFGWDEPDTSFMLTHIDQMEQAPFDGTVFHISYEKKDGSRGNFGGECWGNRAFTPAELKRADDELKQTPFKKFNQNFLRFNVLPGDVDWFDNFDAVTNNAKLAASAARDGKCRGILFDIESYGTPLWDYHKQKDAATRSWDEYAKQARERGKLVMNAFQDGFGDDVMVFMTFAFSLPDAETSGDMKKLPDVKYGLLFPFIEGMLDAAKPGAKIVDGFEISYGYRQAQEFSDASHTVHQRLASLVADPAKYRQTISLGFGLWLDYDWRKKGWDAADPSKNYFNPQQFETSLRFALSTADEFVWIYSETPRWWSENGRVKLPDAYVESIERARSH